MIPKRTLEALNRYIKDHIKPGHFLTAVLSNNLTETHRSGDSDNIGALGELLSHLRWEIPDNCWGSPEKVQNWLGKREEVKHEPE